MSSKSHKKVLLMGKSGSGKTSMRAIIFKSQVAADTRRLSATIDVESSQIKFLGGLRLDLWDCGGQDSFMDSHLTSQSSTIFRSVHSLIYIFDAESPDLLGSDTHYFLKCLGQLKDQTITPTSTTLSPDMSSSIATLSASSTTASSIPGSSSSIIEQGPTIFVLLHKMDLVPTSQQANKLQEFSQEVTKRVNESYPPSSSAIKPRLQFYGTSIWNETLYKAWSIVMAHLMPSLASLRSHLDQFLRIMDAKEIVLFERNTFLVISSVTAKSRRTEGGKIAERIEGDEGVRGESIGEGVKEGEEEGEEEWDKRRFERVSTMVKAFKLGCTKIRAPFTSLTVSTSNYNAVLDILTPETYILVLCSNKIQPAAIELNIKLARSHFSSLEGIGLGK